VFDGLSVVVKVATQWFATFLRAVESVGQTIGWFVDNPLAGLLVGIPLIAKNMSLLAKVMGAAFKTPLMILTLIIGALDEIRAYFDDDVVGLFDDKSWSDEKSKKVHAQRRMMMGMGSAEDAKLVGASDSVITNNPFTRFGEKLGANTFDASQGSSSWVGTVLEGFAKTSVDYSMSALKDFTSWYSQNTLSNQISITINSPDPEKAGESVKKELERMTGMQAAGAR
jgi:hypothetical protein